MAKGASRGGLEFLLLEAYPVVVSCLSTTKFDDGPAHTSNPQLWRQVRHCNKRSTNTHQRRDTPSSNDMAPPKQQLIGRAGQQLAAGGGEIDLNTEETRSLVISPEGRLFSWGTTGSSLGCGHEGVQLVPMPVSALQQRVVAAVAVSSDESFAVTDDGVLWAWGRGEDDEPARVEALQHHAVVAVAASEFHKMALTGDGKLWSWGRGRDGELGHGNTGDLQAPQKVEALEGHVVVAMAASPFTSLAVTADGAVWSWGSRCLGHGGGQGGETVPKQIDALMGVHVADVAAGPGWAMAVGKDGSLWIWGEFRFDAHALVSVPIRVAALQEHNVVGIACGDNHGVALVADGSVWTWGIGQISGAGNEVLDGGLGHGDGKSQLVPMQVETLRGVTIVAVAAAGGYSLALATDGGVHAFGRGDTGALGVGDTDDRPFPVRIELRE